MAVARLLAGAAESHALKDRDIILDHRRLADDEAGGMVEEHALAHAHGRVDVGLEDLRRPALQVKREIAAPPAEQPVGDTMRLDRVVALEEQHRLDEPVGGRVAVDHRGGVGAHGLGDGGGGLQRLGEGVMDDVRRTSEVARRAATRRATASSKEEARPMVRSTSVAISGLALALVSASVRRRCQARSAVSDGSGMTVPVVCGLAMGKILRRISLEGE